MHTVPNILPATNGKALSALQDRRDEIRHLVRAGICGPRTNAVDCGWADDGRVYIARGAEDDGVDVTMQVALLWERGDGGEGRYVREGFLGEGRSAEALGLAEIYDYRGAGGVD